MPVERDDPELDALLELLGRSGFLIHRFGQDHHGPVLLAAVREYGECADVVVLYDAEHAVAWRTPAGSGTDVLSPAHVFWSYAASAVWTLRSTLTLALPGHSDAPATLVPAPPGVGLFGGARRPVRITARTWR